MTNGIWLVASAVTEQPVPVEGRYLHIHGLEVPGVVLDDGTVPRYGRKECIACARADNPLAPLAWNLPRFSTAGTVVTKVEWRWGCPKCLMTGSADSEANAHGLTAIHQAEACPATAVVYYHPENPDCYVYRVARHQHLHALFPEDVPTWTGSFRGHKDRSTACPPWCRSRCRPHVFTRAELEPMGALAALD